MPGYGAPPGEGIACLAPRRAQQEPLTPRPPTLPHSFFNPVLPARIAFDGSPGRYATRTWPPTRAAIFAVLRWPMGMGPTLMSSLLTFTVSRRSYARKDQRLISTRIGRRRHQITRCALAKYLIITLTSGKPDRKQQGYGACYERKRQE